METLVLTNGSDFGLPPSTQYPFSFSNVQDEEAWVGVNDDCQIILWNQTSTDGEHAAGEKAFEDLLAVPEIACALDPTACATTDEAADETVGPTTAAPTDAAAASGGFAFAAFWGTLSILLLSTTVFM